MPQNTFSAKMCSSVSVKCFYLVCLLFLLASTKDNSVESKILSSPATEFSRHRIVQPTVHHGRTKRELSSTKDTSGAHHSDVTVRVQIDGEEHVLDLRLNEDLIADNHVVRYQRRGKTVTYKPKKEEIDLCQYSGTVRGKPDSRVAVSTCRGLRGVIYDGKVMRYIQPVGGNDIQSDHYLYDHSDLVVDHKCGYEGGVTKNESYDPLLMKRYQDEKSRERSRVSRYKRDTDGTQVRGPYNANKLSRYVELVLVSDYREFKANGESVETVHHQLKDVANIINSVYSPLNIFIALVGVVIWTERDEIVLVENGDETLNNFLRYRRQTLLRDIPNDNAHLITGQKFREGVVGKALKGPICTYEFSGGVATNHSEVIGLVATTIAHEMGHNFGMEHDTDQDCACPDDKCIMSPSSTSVMPVHWSECSLKSLALAFERGMDYCLRNKPKRLFDSPTCGNGFVEPGEQCDCGLSPDGSASPCHSCCEPDTCMLRANATCASGTCCDLQTCRPMRAGTVCRSADRECDLPEFCSGHSEFCPRDVYKMDSTPCGNEQAYCVRGSCRSHTDQCRLLWGTTGESSHDKCYSNNNLKGNKNGNCGYDRTRQSYKQCLAEDALCGLLHCRHLNERLEFGMESVAQLSAVFINNNGTIIPCRIAIIDLGLSDVDPGMVPDGARCGDNKMCLNQKCVSVASVQTALAVKESSVCPSNCSGHGVCNSEGHCHCEAGFSPPLCMLPGPGGSYDSGPATDPSVQRNFMVAMYIIFLGIIPLILLGLFLVYYTRHNVLFWWNKPRKSVQSPKKASLHQRISRSASKFAANFQGGPAHAPAAAPARAPDDMSSSLLRSDSDRSPAGNINPSVNFFGNFKGFSLTPMDKNAEEPEPPKPKPDTVTKSAKITPVHRSGSNSQSLVNQGVLKPVLRTAPPLPVVPSTSPKTSPTVKRTNSLVQNKIKSFMTAEKTDSLPVQSNPPPRPVISSPILEASTCTAKELISPLQGSKTLGPTRTAPTIPPTSPALPKRPLSMHSGSVPQKPLPEEPKKVKEGISLNRITSFLKPDKPKEKERNPVERSHSLPKNPNHQVKITKNADKVPLRNLQISNPILQKVIDLPVSTVPVVSDSEDGEEPKSLISRAQSMRAPASQKPTLQSFGSMRQAPGVPRPVSMVGRPTAPPPPAPNPEPTPSLYQNPKPAAEIKTVDYVDVIEEKQAPLAHIDEESSDNIYAVIEESPEKHSKPLPGVPPPPTKTLPQPPPEGYIAPKPMPSNSGSTESMGLLGEIVDEIQNRNFDSIYSASTLSRKKGKKDKNTENRDSTYINTDTYRPAESVYSNSGAKSNVSTTSSGYLHPSAVNVPNYLNKDSQEPNETEKAPPSPKANSKIPTFARQVTTPGLRNTTTFRNVPQSPKITNKNANQKISNSPDVVSSCSVADTKNVKAPDVINNNKVPTDTPKVAVKPTVVVKPNDNRPPLRPAPTVDKKPIAKTAPTLKPVNSSSNLKTQDKNLPVNRVNSKTDVKAIADNLNKNKPKVVPKPNTLVQRTDSAKVPPKLSAKPSNVASLQQKFENRKSIGKEITAKK